MKQCQQVASKRRSAWLGLGLLAVVVLVGCGPNKQMIRLQNEVTRLRRERAREVARLQREKFEAMQTQQVALERQQKRCRRELKYMRERHRRLSFQVSRSARQIQRLLMKMMSDVLLMPMREDPVVPRKKRRSDDVGGTDGAIGGSPSDARGLKEKTASKEKPGGKDKGTKASSPPSPPSPRDATPKK